MSNKNSDLTKIREYISKLPEDTLQQLTDEDFDINNEQHLYDLAQVINSLNKHQNESQNHDLSTSDLDSISGGQYIHMTDDYSQPPQSVSNVSHTGRNIAEGAALTLATGGGALIGDAIAGGGAVAADVGADAAFDDTVENGVGDAKANMLKNNIDQAGGPANKIFTDDTVENAGLDGDPVGVRNIMKKT
ncbi:hypothetical protein [Francisella salimarina]|uniref:hypothetical protein n=1 Tax=Francisella salimarina TaxID=2599927 RepID=UPI0037533A35